MFPGLDLQYADPAQPLPMADEDLEDVGRDVSDLPHMSDVDRDLSVVWSIAVLSIP